MLLPIFFVALLASCKKDRFVDCQFPVDGSYNGFKVVYSAGDTVFSEVNSFVVAFRKGKVEIDFGGSRSRLMEVNACVSGYSTQVDEADDQYSVVEFNFFQDSLYYTLDQYVSNELSAHTDYFLTK